MVVRTDSQSGTSVASPADTIQAFQVQTQNRNDQWVQQLQDDPDRFADIDQHYRQGAGQLVASLLAEVTSNPQMDEHVKRIRKNAALPLRAPELRTISAVFRTPQVDDNSGVAGGKTWGKTAVSCEELSSVISRVGVISRFPRRASICRRHAFTPVFVGVMAVIALGPWELERSY
jgi:hypothetical protein